MNFLPNGRSASVRPGQPNFYCMVDLSRLARYLFDEIGQVSKSDMAARMAMFESMYASGGEWSSH